MNTGNRIPKVLPDRVARFIKQVAKVDRERRKAAGFNKHTYGLYGRIAERFGISRELARSICQGRRYTKVRP